MKNTSDELRKIVGDYKAKLESINETDFVKKPFANRWSKKEELGHLVDSALNNSRRFVIGQYEDQPYIVYNQDQWAAITSYQTYPLSDLVQLWALINLHICQILENTSPQNASRIIRTQELHSIEWLAADYNKHLLHHLHHLLELEPVPYP